LSGLLVILLGGLPTTDVGADGEVPNELASTVKNCEDPPVIVGFGVDAYGVAPPVYVINAVIVPAVMAKRTFCVSGGAFWWGFHSDGSNQAAN
jgi:tryptophan synthase alpha subunit